MYFEPAVESTLKQHSLYFGFELVLINNYDSLQSYQSTSENQHKAYRLETEDSE